jgi:hypothetical protein
LNFDSDLRLSIKWTSKKFVRLYTKSSTPFLTSPKRENKLFAGVGNSVGVTMGLDFVGMVVVATSVAVAPG